MGYAVVKGFTFYFTAIIYAWFYERKHPEFKDRVFVFREPDSEYGRYTVNVE